MSNVAILELVVNQRYFNQLVVNRFHYIASGTPAVVSHSFGCVSATGFIPTALAPSTFSGSNLAESMEDVASDQLVFVSTFCRNLYSVTDFYEVPYAVAITGDRNGQAMSPTLAYGFFSSRARTDIRRGMKRIAGVAEDNIDAGGVVATAFLPSLVALAEHLGAVASYDDDGNTLTYTPAILGVEEYTTSSGKRAYRPYATEAEQLEHVATGMVWSYYPQVRTQVSRQYGRGV